VELVLNFARKKLDLAAFYKYEERSANDKTNELWGEFFKHASGFVYVVDQVCYAEPNRLQEAHNQIRTFLTKPSSASKNAPVLVIACRSEEDVNRSFVTAFDLAEQLGLEELLHNRRWCLRYIDVTTLTGIGEGLCWLSSNLIEPPV